jgi:virginiamycin B lyase
MRILPPVGDSGQMARRAIHVTIAAALLAAGCSTGDTGSSPPARTTSAPATVPSTPDIQPRLETFELPAGAGPHDVAPAADGGIWFTAQRAGYLGHLDPASRAVTQVPLGQGSRPHGVIVGADGAAWVTDGGTNAIVRVDGTSHAVRSFPLPADRPDANLNTAAFDGRGVLWFTGQNGIYGRLDPRTGDLTVYPAPRGRGPYGITTTPAGEMYYASLVGNHIARVDTTTGAATPIDPPTRGQGARRVWSDSHGQIWVSEYNAGQVARFDPATGQWQEWKLPGSGPQTYAVYLDDHDQVWASDFASNTIVRFDPGTQHFTTVALPAGAGSARQLLGRPGQIWGATSNKDMLFVIRTG